MTSYKIFFIKFNHFYTSGERLIYKIMQARINDIIILGVGISPNIKAVIIAKVIVAIPNPIGLTAQY